MSTFSPHPSHLQPTATPNTLMHPTVDPAMLELKSRLHQTWSAGDFSVVAPVLEPAALTFLQRNPVAPGEHVLDVACGDGQLSIPLARAGVVATGIDIASPSIVAARKRARREGLDIRFDEGDAEHMPYGDGVFDVVASFFGVMFAPRPWLATAEMLRVTRAGGRIQLAAWTPDGFIGSMLKVMSRHVTPSTLMAPPLLWGQERTVRSRFGTSVSDIRCERYDVPFVYPYGPEEVVEHYRRYYGPTLRAFEALDPDGQAALRADLVALWEAHNQADDGTVCVEAEMLEVVAVKA